MQQRRSPLAPVSGKGFPVFGTPVPAVAPPRHAGPSAAQDNANHSGGQAHLAVEQLSLVLMVDERAPSSGLPLLEKFSEKLTRYGRWSVGPSSNVRAGLYIASQWTTSHERKNSGWPDSQVK